MEKIRSEGTHDRTTNPEENLNFRTNPLDLGHRQPQLPARHLPDPQVTEHHASSRKALVPTDKTAEDDPGAKRQLVPHPGANPSLLLPNWTRWLIIAFIQNPRM